LVSVAHVDSLVDEKFTFDVVPLTGPDEFAVGVLDAVKRPINVALPELDELKEFGVVGSQVIFLPDELVKYRPVVGHSVEQSSERETVALEHQLGCVRDATFVRILSWSLHNRPPVLDERLADISIAVTIQYEKLVRCTDLNSEELCGITRNRNIPRGVDAGYCRRSLMSLSVPDEANLHPIDMAETLAENRGWEFDRVTEDQIALAVDGQWKTYSLTIAWNPMDETLRFICTFEIDVPDIRLAPFHDLLNRCNDMVWTGAFTHWAEQKLIVWRYGLLLNGTDGATSQQIDTMVASGVMTAERFYPAFQMVNWSDTSPAEALKVAISEVYGRA
jgi:hypothetical protein